MYIFIEITLVAVISYALYGLDISTPHTTTCRASSMSETKHKHQTAPPKAATKDGCNIKKHINNVHNDDLHHNIIDYCQSSGSFDGRCSMHINWKQSNKTHLVQQVHDWTEIVKNAEMKELSDETESSSNSTESTSNGVLNRLYSIVGCKSRDSIWNYKYIGGKKENKIFRGKGKLLFTIMSYPPHGYDYGLKSGHCLRMSEENQNNIRSIEGHFNKDGLISGYGIRIKYRNGTFSKATMVKGVIHGMVVEHGAKLGTNQHSEDSPVYPK